MQFLCCTGPVAALQFEATITGTLQLQPGINKSIQTAEQNGRTIVLVFGLNQETFAGIFLSCTGKIEGIAGVVGATPDGQQTAINLITLSQPQNLTAQVIPQAQ